MPADSRANVNPQQKGTKVLKKYQAKARFELPLTPRESEVNLQPVMKTVLLVEDDENDVFMMKMACQRTGIPHSLQVVGDGNAAINYLSGTDVYSDRNQYPSPDLVFLDIKMPNKSGHEVLEWVRGQPGLKNLPVVMLTSSDERKDVTRAYSLGATSYLLKMTGPAEFGQAVRVILKYWLEMNVSSPV